MKALLLLAAILLFPATGHADQRELDPYRLRFRKTAAELVNVQRLERERKAVIAELEKIIRGENKPWFAIVWRNPPKQKPVPPPVPLP